MRTCVGSTVVGAIEAIDKGASPSKVKRISQLGDGRSSAEETIQYSWIATLAIQVGPVPHEEKKGIKGLCCKVRLVGDLSA